MTRYRVFLIIILIFSLLTLGALTGYFVFAPSSPSVSGTTPAPNLSNSLQKASTKETINSNTKIVYEYVYLGGHKEVNETTAPKSWFGLNLSQFRTLFEDWQIKEFSPQKIIVSKNMNTYSPNHYVLGVYNGYVAVFQKNDAEKTNVKQVTKTPVASLPEQEQKKLTNGIDFYGDSELISILEDYET